MAVIYGGQSSEHEVSLRSAASIIRYLDRERFDIIPIAITKQGQWCLQDLDKIETNVVSMPVDPQTPNIKLETAPDGHYELINTSSVSSRAVHASGSTNTVDVVFPIIHGPHGEDGTLQGLLELIGIPYVGCGVLASAVGMDKDVAKRLARDAGLPIVPYLIMRKSKAENTPEHRKEILNRIDRELGGFPVFIKPANLGSSVGVHRVKSAELLNEALDDAFRFDRKVLIEQTIFAREIEVAVLESTIDGEKPFVSTPGEIVTSHEFYSYEAKYLDENGAALIIPAKLSKEQKTFAQQIAQDVFLALECEGMARVDLFLDKRSGQFYFNEINTIPGFTSISMYPKMCEASGISYRDLLSRLIDLALKSWRPT